MVGMIWWAAIAAGVSYMLPVLGGWQGPIVTAWKGASIGLLALWAAMQAQTRDGWLIAAVLAVGATGDVLLNIYGLKVGAIAFVIGHLIAIFLYLSNQRENPSGSQRALAWLLVPATLVIAWAITAPHPDWPIAAGYAGIAAAMAATAWLSRFPRYRTGIGALLFVASDLAIFAGQVELLPVELRRVTVWPLYFAAQALIAWGVVTTLRHREQR
jgi:uncharacterized membrane protein YhhN